MSPIYHPKSIKKFVFTLIGLSLEHSDRLAVLNEKGERPQRFLSPN